MKFLEFFQEGNGNLSSARLLMLIWGIGILTFWGITSIKTSQLIPIPESVITLFAITVAGKVTQKFGEQKKEE